MESDEKIIENAQIIVLIDFFSSELLWIYFLIVVVIFYILIALLTWNLKKALIFLGFPSISSETV